MSRFTTKKFRVKCPSKAPAIVEVLNTLSLKESPVYIDANEIENEIWIIEIVVEQI